MLARLIPIALLGLLLIELTVSSCETESTSTPGAILDEAIGLETLGGVFTPIIPKGESLPAVQSQVFSTASDNQTSVKIHVLAGNGSMAADNRTLGRFTVIDIPPAPRGVPQIDVSFEVDALGQFKISAVDLSESSGREFQVINESPDSSGIVQTRTDGDGTS